MDQQGHEDKRPRLSTAWPSHHAHGVSLPHPGPPLTTPTTSHHPQPLPPPNPSPYSPSPHLAHPPNPFPPIQEYPPHQQPPPPPQHFDDRRQHEPERYPSAQDHRHHPPPSPAHQQYPPPAYQPPGRDSMVKREAEDVKPRIVRPNSTGNGPEQQSLPPPPPPPPPPPSSAAASAHGPPPQLHMDDRRHMSYDNGTAPQMYRHPSYPPPPQTPLSHTGPPPTPYEQTQMYAPPMGPDGPYPIPYPAGGGKRKSQRASQACEMCRQLKAKCDEHKPCKNCTDKNSVCVYRDPAPKQQDKATQDILDAVQKMLQADKRDILSELMGLKSELRELRSERGVGSAYSLQGVTGGQEFARELANPASPLPIAEIDETVSSSPGDPLTNSNMIVTDPETAAKRMRLLETEEETEEPPGEPVRPMEAPFPHDHTTPAGRLLKWPAIRRLVKPLLEQENVKWIDNYPQRLEESRGQLPLFGRGEGITTRISERDPHYDYVDIADDTSQVGDHPSPSAGTDWGPIGGLSPPQGPGFTGEMRAAISRVDYALDFEEKKVWKLVESYKTHIQNMHPLIPPADLDAMVTTFLNEVGARKSRTQARFASHQETPVQPTIDHERKRKRSPIPNGVEPVPPPKRHKPQRSNRHALVLMVLALGKICSWRDRKLPELPEKDIPNQCSPVVRNGHVTSPNQGSPPSSAFSQSPIQAGLPSPKDHDRAAASRRSSVQALGMQAPTSAASPAPPKKNYEVIPGLEYFAYATDILGNQMGSYHLCHIQAHILACLYYGQLGRAIASFRHIRFACQAIVDKLQPAMARLRNYAESGTGKISEKDNKYLVAFWSCCQLESDILAELNLLPSGILQYESILPMPDLLALVRNGFTYAVVNSYMAQLYLRKRLNEISGQLYNPKSNLTPEQRQGLLEQKEHELQSNMGVYALAYTFSPDEPPAEDILHARFRAKFWGANVLIYRGSIQEIMNASYNASLPGNHETPKHAPYTIENAKKGIEAIMKSTSAFHGLKDKRFIITNIFGTAHAQWGNLITLAAVYQDPTLGRYVDETRLRSLFKRTIEFFEVVAQDSSSLAMDLKILRGLLENLPPKDQLPHGGNALLTHPSLPTLDPHFAPNVAAPHPAAVPSPHSHVNTPSDMGQPTPMEFN